MVDAFRRKGFGAMELGFAAVKKSQIDHNDEGKRTSATGVVMEMAYPVPR